MKMRFSWKRVPRETGLASVGQGTRGYILTVRWSVTVAQGEPGLTIEQDHAHEIANVYAHNARRFCTDSWYWVCSEWKTHGVHYQNTRQETPFSTAQEAQQACLAYVKAELLHGLIFGGVNVV